MLLFLVSPIHELPVCLLLSVSACVSSTTRVCVSVLVASSDRSCDSAERPFSNLKQSFSVWLYKFLTILCCFSSTRFAVFIHAQLFEGPIITVRVRTGLWLDRCRFAALLWIIVLLMTQFGLSFSCGTDFQKSCCLFRSSFANLNRAAISFYREKTFSWKPFRIKP